MTSDDKPLVWLEGEIKTPPFSQKARIEAGFLLRLLQKGESLGMPHSRPMPSVGRRCHELRIRDKDNNWRIFRLVRRMKTSKKVKLQKAGWRVGDAAEFLQLSPEEEAIMEIKMALSKELCERRAKSMTQAELAQRIQSSQPRIAKAEMGDQSVSIELLIRAMLATGATPKDIGKVITQAA